jgi:hypothetical protein
MDNAITRWMKKRKEEHAATVTLDDVVPAHPEEYPAKRLKEKLDARHDAIVEHSQGPMGMPEGPGGY